MRTHVAIHREYIEKIHRTDLNIIDVRRSNYRDPLPRSLDVENDHAGTSHLPHSCSLSEAP